MANNQAFKIKNGLSAKRYLQNSTAVSASDVDLSTGSYFTKTLSANTTFTFSNPPASGKAMGFALEVTGANVTVGYDLANAAYDSVSFSVAIQEQIPRSVVFKPDGTKMYTIGFSNKTVYQYSLSTAWDISTLSYDSKSLSVSALDNDTTDVKFNSDGTKMYVVGSGNDRAYQYSLSTAYDVSTATYDSVFLSFGSQDSNPRGIVFNNNGTKLYMVGVANDTVYQYSMTTAYDLSTASYDSVSLSVTSQDGFPAGLAFNADGTIMYVVGYSNDRVYQYSLSTAYDLSTASYDNFNFSVTTQDSTPRSIAFKDDGTKMYLMGEQNSSVYQYSTAGTATATVAWPSSVKWSGATAPDAPASGEKDVYVFVTTDGGTTYYGKQAGDAVA